MCHLLSWHLVVPMLVGHCFRPFTAIGVAHPRCPEPRRRSRPERASMISCGSLRNKRALQLVKAHTSSGLGAAKARVVFGGKAEGGITMSYDPHGRPPPPTDWEQAPVHGHAPDVAAGYGQPPGYQQLPPMPVKQTAPGHGMHIAALVLGICGLVAGLIPILFVVSLPCGVLAFLFGIMAYRRGRPWVKQGRSGIILGSLATVLGVIGIVIVAGAFDKLDEDLDCLDQADTAAEIDACN